MRNLGLVCAIARRAGASLLASAVPAALILALLPSAAAALTWGARVPADPSSYTNAIDCPTASLCVVGGEGDRIATSTNPAGGAGTWSAGAVPGAAGAEITRISCPSASLCVAVDHDGEALVSTNPAGGSETWTATLFPKVGGNVTRGFVGLSCPSASLCVATDGSQPMLTGLPTAPATWSDIELPRYAGDVSCAPGGACVAAGGSGVFTTTTPSDQSSWAEAGIDPFNGSYYEDTLASVSCLPGLCVGGGAGSRARVYWSQNPTGGQDKWSSEVLTSNLSNMECVGQASTLCVGSSRFGSFVWSSTDPTGGAAAWSLTKDAVNGGDPTVDDNIAGISCPTTETCFAATTSGYVVIGMGTPGRTEPGEENESGLGAGSGAAGKSRAAGGPDIANRPPKVRFLKSAPSTNAIGFLLESAQYATGALSGVTAGSYTYERSAAVSARPKRVKRGPVSLGSVRFKLRPHTPKLVKLKLRRPIRRLLAEHGKLKVKITIALSNASGRRSVTRRRVTLRPPRKHRSHRR